MRLPLTSPPEGICIVRLSAIGDVCHIVPVVRTLQSLWPQTKLTWVIGKTEASLVGDIAGIEFIIFDKSKGWRAYRELRWQMHARRFDVLLQMQAALRASIASFLIPAHIKLGFDKPRAIDYQGLFTTHRINGDVRVHVVDGFFQFLEALGLTERVLHWDIPIPDEARTFAAKHLSGTQRTLLISPCSSHPLRNWRAEHYAQIADYAIEKHGFRVVLCGGPGPLEREYGDVIRQHMRNRPLDLIGKDTLKRMLALLERADVLLSPDSGPVHMAACVGTPVIGLYAASNARRTGPYLSREWCVDKYDEAARRYLKKPAAAIRWGTKIEYPGVMELIAPQNVTDKLDLFMKTDGGLSRESV